MEPNDKMKQIKYAMNSRMFILIGSIVLLMNAITSTFPNGTQYIALAKLVEDYDAGLVASDGSAITADETASGEAAKVAAEATSNEGGKEASEDVSDESGKEAGEVVSDESDKEVGETVSDESGKEAGEAVSDEGGKEAGEAVSDEGSKEAGEDVSNEGSKEADEAASDSTSVDSAEAADEAAPDKAEADGEAASGEDPNEVSVEALKRDMDALGVTANDFRMIGYATVIIAIIQTIIGIICLFLANRVDKASLTLKLVIALIVAEVIYTAFMFFKHALFLGSVLYTILIIGALLWGTIRLLKIAKEDPGRVLAVKTMAQRAKEQQAAAPKKSISERAAMQADDTPEADTEENQEEVSETASADESEAE